MRHGPCCHTYYKSELPDAKLAVSIKARIKGFILYLLNPRITCCGKEEPKKMRTNRGSGALRDRSAAYEHILLGRVSVR